MGGNYWNVTIAGYNGAKSLVTAIDSKTCYIHSEKQNAMNQLECKLLIYRFKDANQPSQCMVV